jgi:hypothetical protein
MKVDRDKLNFLISLKTSSFPVGDSKICVLETQKRFAEGVLVRGTDGSAS